jgi:hypothetical protein
MVRFLKGREMHIQSELSIIENDLDSMRHRIEAGPPHIHMTAALNAVTAARDLIKAARADLHSSDMKRRYQGGSLVGGVAGQSTNGGLT